LQIFFDIVSEKSDMLENVLSREEPKRDTEDNVGNYQGDFQQEGKAKQ
jgi:hypothetical protein